MKTLIAILALHSMCCSLTASDDIRLHPATEMFINNVRSGATNGCTGSVGVTGRMTCGHTPNISEITWEYVASSERGDTYKFTRKFPIGAKNYKSVTKEIIYTGAETTIWQDEFQKIIIRPNQK